MNPSGSEFTLRVAICDLVERLKRMQHKCTYLEECRNQLVKEVIRLRLQNEWLAKQISDSPGASASLPQNLQCFCAQQSLVNSQYHTPHCHLSAGHETNDSGNSTREVDLLCMNHKSNGSSSHKDESLHLMNILNQFEQEDLDNKQDSIKNLTIQMLKDLETEMKTGRLKSDLIQFVKNSQAAQVNGGDDGADPFTTDDDLMKFDDDEVMVMENNHHGTIEATAGGGNTKLSAATSANYEAFNNNSDYYSNSHNLNIAAFEDLQLQMYEQNNSSNKNFKEDDSLLNQSETAKRQQQQSVNKLNISLTHDEPKSKQQLNGDNNNLSRLESTVKTNASLDLNLKDEELISIIIAVKDDLKCLQQGLVASTDKLNKIKSKQLRYYFQQQINLENSGKAKTPQQSTTTTTNSYGGNNSSLK